jgi:hypothetical protein
LFQTASESLRRFRRTVRKSIESAQPGASKYAVVSSDGKLIVFLLPNVLIVGAPAPDIFAGRSG